MCFGYSKELSHRNTFFECLIHNSTIEGKQPKPRFGCIKGPLTERQFFKTPRSYVFAEIKEKFPAQKAHNVGPLTACQQYTFSMAYRWWAFDGPTLCASRDGVLMRRQYFVSRYGSSIYI